MGSFLSGRGLLRLVCFASFTATLFIYSPNVMTLFAFDRAEYTGLFAEPCLIATFATSCITVLLGIKSAGTRFERLLSGRLASVACVLGYACASWCFMACIVAQLSFAPYVLAPCAVLSGICVVGMCQRWAAAFSQVDLFAATCVAVVGLLSSALAHTVVSVLPWTVAFVLESTMLFLGTVPLLVPGLFDCQGPQISPRCQPQAQPPARSVALGEQPGRLKQSDGGRPCAKAFCAQPFPERGGMPAQTTGPFSLGPFLSILGVPLVGMAISSFAIGLRPSYILDGLINVDVLGMYLAVALFAPLVALKRKQPFFVLVYQVYLPILAAAVTSVCVALSVGASNEFACALLCAFFTLVTVEAIAAATAISNAGEFPRRTVFAALIAVYSGLGISGIAAGSSSRGLFENNQELLLILAVVYTSAMLIWISLKNWRGTVGGLSDENLTPHQADSVDVDGPRVPGSSETFEERLAKISSRAGLSARETEIASYVGKGHTSVYVAKTLLISDSTVYTHVRNIYRKLGITSREELIQLFNEPVE